MIKSMIGNGTGSVIDSIIGVPVPNDFVAKYTAYYTQEFNLVTGNKVADQYDQTPQYYGSELVINGDFSDGATDWTIQSIWSIAGGVATSDGSSSVAGTRDLRQNNVFEIGKTYEVTFDIIDYTSGTLRIFDGNTNASYTSLGTKTSILTPSITDLIFNGGTFSFIGSIDNISVKEILTGANDLTQSTSGNQPTLVEQNVMTQFTSADQPTFVEGFSGTGDELITNGDFSDGATDWTAQANWSITGNEAVSSGLVENGQRNLIQDVVIESNKKYIISFNVTSYVSGDLRMFFSSGSILIANSIGHKEIILENKNATSLIFFVDTANPFTGSIDNVSLKEAVKDTTKDKVSFDASELMTGLPPQSGDFTYVFKGINVPDNNTDRFFLSNSSSASDFRIRGTNDMSIEFDDLATFVFANITDYSFSTITFLKEGDTYKVYFDGSLVGQITYAGNNFTIDRLGDIGQSFGGSIQGLEIYDVAVADVNNITEVPVHTLKSDLVDIPSGYGQMPKWYSKQHSIYNNKVSFDDNDFLEGLPPQSGDFTYVFKGLNLPTDTGSSRVFLSNPSEANSLFYVVSTSDKFAIRDVTNTINEFNKVIDYGVDQTVTLTRSGNLFSLYVNGVFQDSITITVGVSGFTALSRANPSFNGSLQELYVYDRALSLYEIKLHSRN